MNYTDKRLELQKSITVLNRHSTLKREVLLSVCDLTFPATASLSELDLEDVKEISLKVEHIIESKDPDEYYDFGVDLCAVSANSEMAQCYDEIESKYLGNIPTHQLLSYLRCLEKFKSDFSDSAEVKKIVKAGFERIKSDPEKYKKWPHATYYEILIDGIIVSLNLPNNALALSVVEYMDQLG